MGLRNTKESGMGVRVVLTRLLALTLLIGTIEYANAHGMDPRCLSPKNSNKAAFYIRRLISVSQGNVKNDTLIKPVKRPSGGSMPRWAIMALI